MLETTENLKGLEIYTPAGMFLGTVDEIIMNIPDMTADGLFVSEGNPALIDKNVSIIVPLRWVQSVGDVIILNTFPERVCATIIE